MGSAATASASASEPTIQTSTSVSSAVSCSGETVKKNASPASSSNSTGVWKPRSDISLARVSVEA